jgi:hypothetical protein
MDTYTIYLVNQSVKSQLFWAFLSAPTVSNDPKVFANSNTNLQIAGASSDLNSFTIPVQYVIGAGASNNAVGLNILITSNATRNANLKQLWDVTYATTPPKEGPAVPQAPTGDSPVKTLAMRTNDFDQAINETNGWYENMSFGVKTAQGFMGVTWVPDPSKTYTITPKLVFYITVGDYSSYSLADINSVANSSAALDTSTDFDLNNVCTVVYIRKWDWSHFPGMPPKALLTASRAQILEFLPSFSEESGQTDVTNIIFGDPITPVATATKGVLEGKLITIAGGNVTIIQPAKFQSGRMKVQWSVNDRPQKQVSRYVEVTNLVVAVHLDEKILEFLP